ncbi:MAG: hypothetical protein MR888_04155 [Clostridiales bacterium]|nr:hypothetical protein [Clostridiales bacterium]
MDLCRDPKTMEPEELRAYLEDVRCELETMDEEEPEDETGEEFVDWAERHEELEDLADEIVEQLEALGERVD